jgi:Tfp pilus assembly protein PilV
MTRAQRGSTLIEAMIAMSVMLTGAAAMIGLNRQALFFNGDGRKMTRAAAVASDLATNLERLPYNDALLSNPNTSNDNSAEFHVSPHSTNDIDSSSWIPSSAVDHYASELPTNWPGVTNGSAIAGQTTLGDSQLQIFWNVKETVGATYSFKTIAVIVRWPHGNSWRRMVVLGVKPGAPYIP